MIKIPFVKSIAKTIEQDCVNFLNQKQSICSVITSPAIFEQVVLFAGTLFPNEKIIVSRQDFGKIITAKDRYGCYFVRDFVLGQPHVLGFKLEIESINNCPRAEFGETRTNCNFKLK